jgi:Protein of unknown function (DUF3140)
VSGRPERWVAERQEVLPWHPMSRQKRRVDLTDEDERVMRKVVDRIHAERRDDLEPTAGQENWRHRLMTIGHDPLKPPR